MSQTEKEFTHFDDHGNAYMVDVSEKEMTKREAMAQGVISLSREAFEAVLGKKSKRGMCCVWHRLPESWEPKRLPI